MRLIDADRLLTNRMKSKYYHLPNGDIAIPIIDIEHAPTIEPQRTGKWHVSPNGYFYRCQYCGKSRDRSDARFCWYCGARMEGEG